MVEHDVKVACQREGEEDNARDGIILVVIVFMFALGAEYNDGGEVENKGDQAKEEGGVEIREAYLVAFWRRCFGDGNQGSVFTSLRINGRSASLFWEEVVFSFGCHSCRYADGRDCSTLMVTLT